MKQQLSREFPQQIQKKTTDANFYSSILQKLGCDNLACILTFTGSLLWVIGFIYPNQHNFSFSLTVLVRGFTVTIMSYLICFKFGYETDFKNPLTFRQLFLRNSIMVIQGVAVALVSFYLPQFLIHTIGCAGPLGVFIVDYYKFGITINKKQLLGLLVGVIGLIFTVNGQLITSYFDPSYEFESEFANYKTDSLFIQFLVSIALLIVTFLWAYGACITKSIKSNGVQINFYLGVLLVLFSGISYPLSQDTKDLPTISQFIYGIFLSGMVIAVGQILFVIGLSIAVNTGIVTLMSFNAVIISYLISVFRYGEAINYVCLAGGALIIYGVVTVVLNKQKIKTVNPQAQQKPSYQKPGKV